MPRSRAASPHQYGISLGRWRSRSLQLLWRMSYETTRRRSGISSHFAVSLTARLPTASAHDTIACALLLPVSLGLLILTRESRRRDVGRKDAKGRGRYVGTWAGRRSQNDAGRRVDCAE